MKTAITINLGGIVFHIDDDAYEILHTYLIAVERQFVNEDECKEVMSDIEARLSELFSETLGEKRDVIMKSDVSKVIDIMGEPEAFMDEENTKESNKRSNWDPKTKKMNYKKNRRLYRDSESRVLGGVCGGLGAYFNTDPILFRIIFIIIFFGMGSGLIIYLILWIVIPEATTTAQKLEMRGEEITIENIKKAVREEFDHVRRNMKF